MRDRYIDFLRAFAICMVVLGHWLITALVRQDGGIQAPELLATVTWTQWLTLGFQIMPIFFLAGGYAAAGSWAARDEPAAVWIRGRSLRLLLPTAAYVALVLAAVAICLVAGVDHTTLALVGWAMAMQFWFLPVYLLLSALTPVLHAAHRRWGLLVPVGLAGAAVMVETLQLSAHLPQVGNLNFLLVWGTIYQLGFCWRDGILGTGRRPLIAMVLGGSAAFAVLVGVGPFPPSLIYVSTEKISNTSPPSPALLAYALAQTGVCILAAPAARRLLRRESLWRLVGPIGRTSMSLYLWHMLPVIIAAGAFYLTDLAPEPQVGSAVWWTLRLPWLVLLATILAAVLWVLRPLEYGLVAAYLRVAPNPPRTLALVAGLVLTAIPLSSWAVHGLAPGGRFPLLAAGSFTAGSVLVIAGLGARRPARVQAGRQPT